MNSFISASEPLPEAAWSGMLWRYAFASVVTGILLAALIVILDPYDTGRLTPFSGSGIPDFGQRLTAASLARAPDTAAAIIGNSTIQLIDPGRLSELTGMRFVSLAIPATGPVEQLTVARWLVGHHAIGGDGSVLKALVIGLDESWCLNNAADAAREAFPFWLYSDGVLEYVHHLINFQGLTAARRKLNVMLGMERPLRRDGYRDYEIELAPKAAAAAATLREGTRPVEAARQEGFESAGALQEFVATTPSVTAIVLVFVPRYVNALPVPGSPAEQQEERCKAAFRDLAASRSHTIAIDFLKDGEIARDPSNFWDRIHYRKPVARLIEEAIAHALTSGQ